MFSEEETGLAPEFSQPLKPVVAKLSEVVELRSVVKGVPMPKVTWYRDTEEIIPDVNHEIKYDEENGETTLTIMNTSLNDECVYAVEATNDFGKATCRANVVLG